MSFQIPMEDLQQIEANVFFAFTTALSHLQSFYLPEQPGIMEATARLGDLLERVDGELLCLLS